LTTVLADRTLRWHTEADHDVRDRGRRHRRAAASVYVIAAMIGAARLR
jgi:hypothetical protein